jgi:glycosyltransferase involved in cell wall biosynthesis
MQEQAKLIKARPGNFYWFATQLERFTLWQTLGVFCNSAYTESMVQKRTRRTWRVPNAIRKEFFETRLPIVSKTSKPILLNIGAISPRKRQLPLLDLANELFQTGLSFEMQFIGAANPRNDYGAKFLRQVELAEKNGFARYLGEKELPELIEALDAASALIHAPSEEAFGLVVAEALSRNLKLFGTNVGGIPDIARDVEAVELFPLDDSAALANAISRWLRLGTPHPQSAANDMRSRYHPEMVARRHIEIYREVLNTSS